MPSIRLNYSIRIPQAKCNEFQKQYILQRIVVFSLPISPKFSPRPTSSDYNLSNFVMKHHET